MKSNQPDPITHGSSGPAVSIKNQDEFLNANFAILRMAVLKLERWATHQKL
jgi:hypothetical protein